jgi:hypothetical protein
MSRYSRRFELRLRDGDERALDEAAARYGMGRAELVRTLVHAAAASDDAGDAGQVLVDARTAVRLERDARSLGYLLNQCARALNGIAKSCREQDVDSENLAEALEGVRLDLAVASDDVATVREGLAALSGRQILREGR